MKLLIQARQAQNLFPDLVKEAIKIDNYVAKVHFLLSSKGIPHGKLIDRLKIVFNHHDATILDAKARLEQSIALNQRLLQEIHQLKTVKPTKKSKSRKVSK